MGIEIRGKEANAQTEQNQATNETRKIACFEGIGWKIRLQQKRSNYFLTLAKEIVVGNALRKGDEVFYYLVDCDGRKAVLAFLDGKERFEGERLQLNNITFLIKR